MVHGLHEDVGVFGVFSLLVGDFDISGLGVGGISVGFLGMLVSYKCVLDGWVLDVSIAWSSA